MSQINEGPDSEKLDAYYKKIKAKSSHDDGDSKFLADADEKTFALRRQSHKATTISRRENERRRLIDMNL